MVLNFHHLIVGSGVFGLAVYGGYKWAESGQAMQKAANAAAHGGCDGCAFDRLAPVYDDIVGGEESGMFMGWFRNWLLLKAQGDVLELSAGTGRNLQHFWYSRITSLTLADVSASMLQQAQLKYFNELRLHYKQPDVPCRFVLADAEDMVAAPGQLGHIVRCPLAPGLQTSSSGSSSSSGSGSNGSSGTGGGMWRLKQRSSSSSDGSGSSSSSSGNAPSSSGRDTDGVRGSDAATATASTSTAAQTSGNSDSSSSSSRGWTWRQQQQAAEQGPDSSSNSSNSSSSSNNSSSSLGTSRFEPHSFDTVVDTFGLCSCKDPVQALEQAAQLLKPGGKLLLLEHGRGSYNWINSYIDSRAERHFQLFGCWFNRDILSIVEAAGLHVDSVSRWHLGTTYLIVASPLARLQTKQPAEGALVQVPAALAAVAGAAAAGAAAAAGTAVASTAAAAGATGAARAA